MLSDAKQGELVEYFDSNIKKSGKSWSVNPRDIDVSKYKQTLWNTVEEVLEIVGYPVDDLAEKFGVKTTTTTKKQNVVTMMQYLPAV